MSATGLSHEEATKKLAIRVRVTCGNSVPAIKLAEDVQRLLERTIAVAEPNEPCDVELCIQAHPVTNAPMHLSVEVSIDGIVIRNVIPGSESHSYEVDAPTDLHGLFRKAAACYIAGHVIACSVGQQADASSPFAIVPEPFVFNFAALGVTAEDLERPIQLTDTVLVGAGGVANGFLWAADELKLHGEIAIVDPKKVSAGNSNRCLYFDLGDVGRGKAELLAERVNLPGLHITPVQCDLHRHLADRPGKKATRVIVTTDSRRARRSIQGELPAEVLDASTTDISEIVVHSHSLPNEGACLSCIYAHTHDELQQDKHLAEKLGLTIEEIRTPLIDRGIATKLAANFPGVDAESIIGTSLDTFYKKQCGEGALLTKAGKQAAAPFAFISNLAGVFLALELVRFEKNKNQSSRDNYFFASPWQPPHRSLRRRRRRLPTCEFCGDPHTGKALRLLWPERYLA